MKMIRAKISPEDTDEITEGLIKAGFVSLTKIDVIRTGVQNL